MPVNLQPTAGSTVSVSAALPATFDVVGYAALTWTDAAGFDNLGQLGDMYEVGTFDDIVDGRQKYRAINDAGSVDGNKADDPADPGQIIMQAAFDAAKGSTAERFAYRIQSEDGSKGTYATLLVAGWQRVFGGASDVWMRALIMPAIPGTVKEF